MLEGKSSYQRHSYTEKQSATWSAEKQDRLANIQGQILDQKPLSRILQTDQIGSTDTSVLSLKILHICTRSGRLNQVILRSRMQRHALLHTSTAARHIWFTLPETAPTGKDEGEPERKAFLNINLTESSSQVNKTWINTAKDRGLYSKKIHNDFRRTTGK